MDNEFNFESGRVRKKSSFIFGILRVDLGGDLGRFFFFWVVIGVDIGSVALPSCIIFTSSSGTVARFGAVAPLFFRNRCQRVRVARLGVRQSEFVSSVELPIKLWNLKPNVQCSDEPWLFLTVSHAVLFLKKENKTSSGIINASLYYAKIAVLLILS